MLHNIITNSLLGPERMLRQIARRTNVGKVIVRYNDLRATGLEALLKTAYIKRFLLPRIFEACPMVSNGDLEVHMLLNHARVSEGAWSMYSFGHFVEIPCRFVIHDDGSLSYKDISSLNHLFPGIRIVCRDRKSTRLNSSH